MARFDLEEIRMMLPEELELVPARGERGKYICPKCGSGSRGGTAAFSIMHDGIHAKCFSCGKYGDVFDWRAAIDGISIQEATRKLIEKYKPRELSPGEAGRPRKTDSSYRVDDSGPRMDFSEQIARAAAALPGSPGEKYLTEVRKLSPEVLVRFRYGYIPSHFFPGRGRYPAIIFPYSPKCDYVGWRAIREGERHYDKPRREDAGIEPVYNAGALYSGGPCFVIESQLDVAAITMAGGQACSLGGGGTARLKAQLERKPPAGPLILCFDNDPPGQADTERAAEILEGLRIPFADASKAVMGGRKDPGEVLQLDGEEALREGVAKALSLCGKE